MAGQRQALKLAREKGVNYAERLIDAAQQAIREKDSDERSRSAIADCAQSGIPDHRGQFQAP
jgi:hypothetical protein